MSDDIPHAPRAVSVSTWELIRDAIKAYFHFLPLLLAVIATRLLPFYLLFWFIPFTGDTVRAIMETAVAVPCVAALIRIVWAGTNGDGLGLAESLLGAPAVPTLKLLATNLFLLMVALTVAQFGPQWFLGFLVVWTWAALLTDQVVLIEDKMLVTALARSYAVVRQMWKPSLLALFAVVLPEAANVALTQQIEGSLPREILTRTVTVVSLPFSVTILTLFYQRAAKLIQDSPPD